jgi:glutamine cyclotransferase
MNKKVAVAITFVLITFVIFSYQRNTEKFHEFYCFQVVNIYPHDPTAFTQGLEFFNGYLYEGTGLYGDSDVRVVEIKTGEIIQSKRILPEYFGEGVTVFEDKVYQLTWKENTGFVYNLDLEQTSSFQITGEGWGLTNDETNLIMSNGSSVLSYLDPLSYKVIKTIQVSHDGYPVSKLNELEYIKGKIFANIWQTDNIVLIDPQNGKIISWIDLSGLKEHLDTKDGIDVLNGIAYDKENDRLFVTGKLWPNLFEIEIIPEK